MNKRGRLAATVVAVTLTAGAGLAAAPAQAKTTSTVMGSTVISILPSARVDMSLIGVQFQALEPATFSDAGEGLDITFPAAPPVKKSVLQHAGTMAIGSALARLDLATPQLTYATKAGATTGRITFLDEYDALGLKRVPFFDVSDMSVTVTKGKARKAGAKWKRTDTQLITGKVSISSDAKLVSAINAYVGTTYFTPGLDFATMTSSVAITVTCTTAKECA
jgi:hypothetical protein